MIRKSHFFFVTFLLSISVILSSSMPASTSAVPDATTVTAKVEPAPAATANAEKKTSLSYKELKAIATQLKGSKLTFKEKVGLKLFGKRIANKLTAMPMPGAMYGGGGKSQLVALLLCGFLGCFGVHRFYLGYTWQGIVQLLTLGGCGIWALIDFIRICTGSLQPRDSDYDVTL
jgi:hypothetical protein